MPERFDVIIVGGGPAGSSCARELVRAGLSVAVADRAAFPRDKPCAGWITPDVVTALGLDLADYARAHTLQPTELIHEAYLRLTAGDDAGWEDRVHFKRVAARAMRNILVDHARARLTAKRGGGQRRVTLDTPLLQPAGEEQDVVAVHEGLEKLSAVDRQLADIVELRFFAGMTMEEVAAALGISSRTAARGWRLARAWWFREFGGEGRSG